MTPLVVREENKRSNPMQHIRRFRRAAKQCPYDWRLQAQARSKNVPSCPPPCLWGQNSHMKSAALLHDPPRPP